MVDKAGKLIVRLEEGFGLKKNTLTRRGLKSVFDIAATPKGQFIRNHYEALSHGVAGDLYDRAMGYAQQVAFAYRQHRQVAAQAPESPISNPGPSYVSQFNTDWRAMTASYAIDANTSPAAYLTSLYKLALDQEQFNSFNIAFPLAKRRPDIQALVIDEDAVNKVVPTLEIVNDVLTAAVQSQLNNKNPDEVIASTYYPNSLPYHFAFEQAQQGMLACNTTLADTKLLADPAWPYFNSKSYEDERVNTGMQDSRWMSAVAALRGDDGGWIVAWTGKGPDGLGWGVYQQCYNKSGVKVGSETRVNTHAADARTNPDIAGLHDGGWVVVWQSKDKAAADWNVYQQRYDKAGLPLGDETRINEATVADQGGQKVAGLKNGGWVVVWPGQGDGKIYQKSFNDQGQATPERDVQVAVADGSASVAALEDGGWVVAWSSRSGDPAIRTVYQRTYQANGAEALSSISPEQNSYIIFNANAVAGLKSGGWAIVYNRNIPRVQMSAYNSSGRAVATDTFSLAEESGGFGDNWAQSCTALKDGGWVVAWSTGEFVYQQRYDQNGTTFGDIGVVNRNSTGEVGFPKLAGLEDGGWVVTWAGDFGKDGNGSGIYQQRFNHKGGRDILDSGRPKARTGEESAVLRIGSKISPALRDTIEHAPYFSTVMCYVTGSGEVTIPPSLGNGVPFFKWSVSELTPWYSLSKVAFITPQQSGVANGPTTILPGTQEAEGWDTTLTLNNIGTAKPIEVKAVNYLRVCNPAANNHAYSLNNTYVNCDVQYADLVLRVPTFGFNISNAAVMPADGCVSFFIRMVDTTNKRCWTEISYTFASKDYNQGQIYTADQRGFYNKYFSIAGFATGQYYASLFASVGNLCNRTGLSVPELESMLATQVGGDRVVVSPNIVVRNAVFTGAAGVGPITDQTTHETYHYGAVYLHGGKKPALWLSADSDGNLTLNELTDDRMDRMNRIIRLQRVLDIPFDQLDYLITAGMHAEGTSPDKSDGNLGLYMNANTTRLLGVFNFYQQRYGVTAEQFAAITDQITPYAIAPGIPLLDRVFNRKKLFDQAYSVDWQSVNPLSDMPRDARIMKQLAAGLGISDDDMRFLALQMGDTFENNLANISSFYRIVMLSRWFGLDVVSFMQLVRLMDVGYDGITPKQHLLTAPMILPTGNADQTRRDWLDWLLLISIAADWLTQTGLSVGEIAVPLNEATFAGTQGRSDFVQQLKQATIPTLVTDNVLLHADLPRTDTNGQPIHWIALLSNPDSQSPSSHQLIDATGLVLDGGFALGEEQIKASVSAIVDAQLLTMESKDKARTTLSTVIYAAQQSQNGMLGAMVAQLLSIDQGLVLPFCRWADITPYQLLALVLAEPNQDEMQAAENLILNRFLNLFAQYAHVAGFYELSPAMLNVFARNRRWFADSAGPLVLLPTHYSFASYRQWLHRTSWHEDDLLDVLSAGSMDNFVSETSRSRLARTLDWDTQSVGTALDHIKASPNDPGATMFQIAAVMRLQDLSQQTGLMVEDLIRLEALELESDYAAWQHLGQAIVVGASRSALQ